MKQKRKLSASVYHRPTRQSVIGRMCITVVTRVPNVSNFEMDLLITKSQRFVVEHLPCRHQSYNNAEGPRLLTVSHLHCLLGWVQSSHHIIIKILIFFFVVSILVSCSLIRLEWIKQLIRSHVESVAYTHMHLFYQSLIEAFSLLDVFFLFIY